MTGLDILHNELHTIIERVLTESEAADGHDNARAESVAYCIAVMENPDNPDAPGVAKAAVRRVRAEMASERNDS